MYYVDAVQARDYSVVMGLTVLLSLIVISPTWWSTSSTGCSIRGRATREPDVDAHARPRRIPELVHAGPSAPVATGAGTPIRQTNLWKDAWYRYIRNRAAVVAGAVFVAMVLFCLVWPVLSPHDPYDVQFSEARQDPSLEHPLGTDTFGRDLLTRLALGGRISIGIGFAATIVILVIGVTYGSISGFIGGQLDNAMMRFLDALYGLPYLPFAIITLAILGGGDFWSLVIALSIASWLTTARIVRGQVITLKENDYVRAANVLGARWLRVLARHVLPNTLGILIIAVFLELPGVVLGEAFLSFIGLGIGPPDASWGSMAQEGYKSLSRLPDPDPRPLDRDRDAHPLREFHRGRAPRRARPAHEGNLSVAEPLLSVRDLRTQFFTREGVVHAVDGVSFDLEKGQTLGIVGESGCGKTVTALSIMGLIPKPPAKIVGGEVLFQGRDLTTLSERQLEDVRGSEIAMIFQDPMTSLNPTLTIGVQITETIRRHFDVSKEEARRRAHVISSRRCTSRTRPRVSTTTRTAFRAGCASE